MVTHFLSSQGQWQSHRQTKKKKLWNNKNKQKCKQKQNCKHRWAQYMARQTHIESKSESDNKISPSSDKHSKQWDLIHSLHLVFVMHTSGLHRTSCIPSFWQALLRLVRIYKSLIRLRFNIIFKRNINWGSSAKSIWSYFALLPNITNQKVALQSRGYSSPV